MPTAHCDVCRTTTPYTRYVQRADTLTAGTGTGACTGTGHLLRRAKPNRPETYGMWTHVRRADTADDSGSDGAHVSVGRLTGRRHDRPVPGPRT